jgi:hypothetical protein
VAEEPAQCRASQYVVFIVRYWAGHVTDSDNTGGCGVCGGCENCVRYWAGQVTDSDNTGGCGVCENWVPKCSLENLGGRSCLRDQVVGVSIILKWILEMWEFRLGTGSIWL